MGGVGGNVKEWVMGGMMGRKRGLSWVGGLMRIGEDE